MYNIEDLYTTIYFNSINPQKKSIIFTWDDNFERHIKYIAPVFKKYRKKCTFYINPGEENFNDCLQSGYSSLAYEGFEIGSHGYTHHHYSSLSSTDQIYQLKKSKEKITDILKITPITFAFPHHDFTSEMLREAKKIYFETRNTLNNTSRFSLKSHTSLSSIKKAIDNAISTQHSIVFSGHSVSLDTDVMSDGYEPLSIDFLEDIINLIIKYDEMIEICTFSQATLKEYIISNCQHTNQIFQLSRKQLAYLKTFGLTLKRIEELV